MIVVELSIDSLSSIKHSKLNQEFKHILSDAAVWSASVEFDDTVLFVPLSNWSALDVRSEIWGDANNAGAEVLDMLDPVGNIEAWVSSVTYDRVANVVSRTTSSLAWMISNALFFACLELPCMID